MADLITAGPPATDRSLPRRSARPWWIAVAGITLLGLGIRLAAVLVEPHKAPGGDAYEYHAAATLIAHGIFGVNPPDYYQLPGHPQVATAFYAPMFSFVLSLAPLVGASSFLADRLWCCAIGAAAIPLAALVGRQLAAGRGMTARSGTTGRRVGLAAAVLVAVYPNLWMSSSLGLSETLEPLVVLLVLLAAYGFWRRPSFGRISLLGAAVAVAALTHDELAFLALFVLVPLALLTRFPWRRRLGLALSGLAVAGLVVGPWVGFNLTRFSKPVFISDNLGFLLANADCPQTWYTGYIGYWSFQCAVDASHRQGVDESVVSSEEQQDGLRYIDHHLGSLPRVTAAKVGRGLGFYEPIQQVRLDHFIETRPLSWAYVGLGMYYVLIVLSVGGLVVLRRRAVPVFPLVAIGVIVVLAMAVGFGQTRYRTAVEVPLVLLAAVALEAGIGRLRSGSPAGVDDTSC